LTSRLARGQRPAKIVRLESGRIDLLRDVVRRKQPVIIGPAPRGWRKLPRWTPATLVARLGTRRVQVASSATETFGYGRARAHYDVLNMAFDGFIERIERPPAHLPRLYLMQQPLRRCFPELEADLAQPSWLAKRPVIRHLWVSADGNATPLHHDTAHNLIANIYGRKRFLCFSPEDTARLYPHPKSSRYPHVSRVNPERPNLATFPAFADARAFGAVLEAGELLYLPPGWWHHVRSLGVTISVNTWWAPPGVRLDEG
jgi:hypothetical protein